MLPRRSLPGCGPDRKDSAEWVSEWEGRGGAGVAACSEPGRPEEGEEEEAPAGPGGDPTGALIPSTVAKGLVVSGIIQRRGRLR